jgi:hypothetical protein
VNRPEPTPAPFLVLAGFVACGGCGGVALGATAGIVWAIYLGLVGGALGVLPGLLVAMLMTMAGAGEDRPR